MTPFDSAAFNRLLKWIDERDASETAHLRKGVAQDLADYKKRTGQLCALDDVREQMKLIESDLRQGK